MEKQINSNVLYSEQFQRSNNYDPKWVFDNEMGPNPLWLTEILAQPFGLEPGMRVLDLGCGKGLSSVFLAREFGVQVYAVDLWENADGKWEQAKKNNVEHLIIPIHADAHKLPFARGFFDAILCIDSYIYFGQDDMYLENILNFLRPGGKIGMIVPGYMRDVSKGVPDYLIKFLGNELWTWQTLSWWKNLWEKNGLVSINLADNVKNGFEFWLRWEEIKNSLGINRHPDEIDIFKKDKGEYMGFIRMVATKN
jgi:cyclopropane fatty-acyl-phospholipid synthase-like methyltransferase